MAGGVLKGFGGVSLAIGLVLLLVGIAAVAYAANNEEQNEDQGLFRDSQESDENQGIMYGGAAAAAVGLIVTIIAIILLVSGGARSQNETNRAIAEARPRNDAKEPPGTMHEVPVSWAAGEEPRSNARPFIAIAVVVAIIVAIFLLMVTTGVVETDGNGVFGPAGKKELLNETKSGTLEGAYTVGMYSEGAESGSFVIPRGTDTCTLTLTWETESLGGANQLRMSLVDDEGQLLGRNAGSSPILIIVERSDLGGTTATYTVSPASSTTYVNRQPFEIQIVCMG